MTKLPKLTCFDKLKWHIYRRFLNEQYWSQLHGKKTLAIVDWPKCKLHGQSMQCVEKEGNRKANSKCICIRNISQYMY